MNAFRSMVMTVLGMVMELRKTQPSKAALPIEVTEAGIIVFWQPATSVPVDVSTMALQFSRES